MKKKKKYLPLYYKWMETGELPDNGLCNVFSTSLNGLDGLYDFSDHPLFRLFYDGQPHKFWAADENAKTGHEIEMGFSVTRQNIVLLMAAMNGEL